MFSEDVVISPKEIFTAPPVIVIFALVPTVISFTSTLASNVGVFIVTDPPATTAKLSTVVETKGSPVIAIKLLVLSVISPLETVKLFPEIVAEELPVTEDTLFKLEVNC
jgi:hypothetical protein